MNRELPQSRVVKLTQAAATSAVPAGNVLITDDGVHFRICLVKRGGMGIVYICAMDDDETAEPTVALKTFDDSFFFDPLMQAAVERESQTWLRVSGVPYVLPLLGIVSTDHKPHLLMPAMNPTDTGDVSLADEIRRNPHGLPAQRCLVVATRLAIALTECIRRVPDLVHGDIKPENILLAPDGSPNLADFGAARLASQAAPHAVALGTALYLAPECWAEECLQTQAADSYAFGATLFEMLSGAVPFAVADQSIADLERLHREEPATFPVDVADDPLEQALRTLSLECLQKDPAARPATAREILKRLYEIGDEHDPEATFIEMMQAVNHRCTPEHPEVVASRVASLLRQGDGETALGILETLPPDQITGKLLKLYGTACSLANRDERALTFFERYLEVEQDEAERIGCLNEKGLSLKRLKRFDEARKLYEDAIPRAPREAQLMLRGNYAATLIEQGDVPRAIGILRQLANQHADSPEAWALLADALSKTDNLTEAISAMQRAVQISPRNGNYRIMLARFLMDGPRDIGAALAALDAAYGLGCHTREWVIRTLACNLLLDNRDHVAGLLGVVREDLSDEEAEQVLKAALEMSVKISAPASEGESADSADTDVSGNDAIEAPPEEQIPAEPQTQEDHEDEIRARIRAGIQPHLQTRLSFVDGSLLFDFYYGVEQPGYAQAFAKTIADIAVQVGMGQMGSLRQRAKAYAFARCPSCGVVMLTQRDERESYTCQGCNNRVTTSLIRNEALDRLLSEVAAAMGQQPEVAEGGTLFVAIAPNDEDQARAIKMRFTEAGYTLVENPRNVHAMFAMQAHDRGIKFPGALQVWMRKVATTERTAAEDGTPADLDQLLRVLRREAGHTLSLSATIPKDNVAFMMLTEQETFEELMSRARAQPDDLPLVRTAIEAATRINRLDEARQLLKPMRLASPEDPDCLAAAAALAIAEGSHERAIPMLETVLRARPRDQAARTHLFRAYQATGDTTRAAAMLAELRSHGVLRT